MFKFLANVLRETLFVCTESNRIVKLGVKKPLQWVETSQSTSTQLRGGFTYSFRKQLLDLHTFEFSQANIRQNSEHTSNL